MNGNKEVEVSCSESDVNFRRAVVCRLRLRREMRSHNRKIRKQPRHSTLQSLPGVQKPKRNAICLDKKKQDGNGRLIKPIDFPHVPSLVSLGGFKRKAASNQLKNMVPVFESEMQVKKLQNAAQKYPTKSSAGMNDVPRIEHAFWRAMSDGIAGTPISVTYGVDVEAEGTYDAETSSYIEGNSPSACINIGKKATGVTAEADIATGIRSRSPIGDVESKGISALEPPPLGRLEKANDGDAFASPKFSSKFNLSDLNKSGVLRHIDPIPGITHSMFYVGQLFTRFCWHVEDAYLTSVSYLHGGSSEKVWYVVPPHHAADFEKFAASNVFVPNFLRRTWGAEAILKWKSTIFHPGKARMAGVDVYRIVHKPGTFVVTAPRGYHAGFNCGFNIAEAINFANPSWFPVGRRAMNFARSIRQPLAVPWELMLFREATGMKQAARQGTVRMNRRTVENALVVAKELGRIIEFGESRLKTREEESQCQVVTLHEGSLSSGPSGSTSSFEALDRATCAFCLSTPHFYIETCSTCRGTSGALCVQHFGKRRVCKEKSHRTVLVRRYQAMHLLDLLHFLEGAAGVAPEPFRFLARYRDCSGPNRTEKALPRLRLRMNLKEAAQRTRAENSCINEEESVSERKRRGGRSRGSSLI